MPCTPAAGHVAFACFTGKELFRGACVVSAALQAPVLCAGSALPHQQLLQHMLGAAAVQQRRATHVSLSMNS